MATLAELIRGLGKGSFAVADGKGRKRKVAGEKGSLDVEELAGGKVSLSKDVSSFFGQVSPYSSGPPTQDTEVLLIHLTLLGYIEECKFTCHFAMKLDKY